MDDGRELRGTRNPFDVFGGFGTFGGFASSIFGRNPFDDPFFTPPFGSVSTQATPMNEPPSNPTSRGPEIHELDSDDEREGEQENEGDTDDNVSKKSKEPFVEHPDEEPMIGENENVAHGAYFNKAEGTQARTFRFHSCKVTYGGIDGAYYTSSSTRRIGDDGALMEECKEADKRTGEAKHRISRGIHDKGHSLTRKLNSDGKVETLQALHNLNEDEMETFENSWRGNAGMSDWVGLLPSSRRPWGAEETANSSNRQKPKKVVRINIE